jgi:alpha-ketoglutarate-dependent taurine dioxygenase
MEPMRMSWEQSDLVLWDEAATQHAAVHDYYGHRRELHRVLVSGSSPPK